MTNPKKIYFVSDLHLGLPSYEKSLEREKLFVAWLDEIKNDAGEIYLLGDIFDFWFEYKTVVPRGFTRLLGKIAELTDSGIHVYFFTGNHDIWVFDYLPRETGVTVVREPIVREWNGKKFYIAHGDGLGPFDRRYKVLKKIFTNRISHWLFARLHPNFGIGFAHLWSHKSREYQEFPTFKGEDKEWLIRYSKMLLQKEHFDYFIFGHRHVPVHIPLNDKSHFINLGDWLFNFTYAVFDGEKAELKKYEKN
ncbi:MAG: UDP-2,3-diacylglucosamine diphosphatase [Bacteroidia bacterium]|nr:UDP-2,3-diacylglucosamine diphosphatase [Bacteroidia bacterium]